MRDTARALTTGVGGDERSFTGMMNQAQYNLRAGGQRYELAGINDGAGYAPEKGLDKVILTRLPLELNRLAL